jgi:16S rRNA (uracil1498-N3)-methyltransferase
MQIEELTSLRTLLNGRADGTLRWYMSIAEGAKSIRSVSEELCAAEIDRVLIVIGPEGGWTDEEVSELAGAGLTGVSLGDTILRVETAAVSAAAIMAAIAAPMWLEHH